MFSPSDFNSAVPQFTNGNYANNPLSPLYIEEPGAIDYNRGVEPLQTLPAQWWNWLGNQFTSKLNKLNIYVKNIFDELTQLLSLVGVTPDATEVTITTGQIKDAFETKYPNFLSKFIHTIAEAWSYIGTTVVGDVTTTQTSKLAVFDHVNTSDASTTPPTVTDEYKTKYVDNLPVSLGGTGANTASDAMLNLVSPLNTISGNTGLITDEVLFERNLLGQHFVKKMNLTELVNITEPVIPSASTTITGSDLFERKQFVIWFTADIGSVDGVTALTISYNNASIPVKVMRNGLLTDMYAKEVQTNVFKYVQANALIRFVYTADYDGNGNPAFIVVGNPVVYSVDGFLAYADGHTVTISTTQIQSGDPLANGDFYYVIES